MCLAEHRFLKNTECNASDLIASYTIKAIESFLIRFCSEASVLGALLQPIECVAAIAWEAEKPLDVTTVIVDPPKAGEVRIKACFGT